MQYIIIKPINTNFNLKDTITVAEHDGVFREHLLSKAVETPYTLTFELLDYYPTPLVVELTDTYTNIPYRYKITDAPKPAYITTQNYEVEVISPKSIIEND